MTIDANGLKAKCNDFLAAVGQDDLKQIFSDFGAAKFGEIKAEDFGKVAAAIDAKMAESE